MYDDPRYPKVVVTEEERDTLVGLLTGEVLHRAEQDGGYDLGVEYRQTTALLARFRHKLVALRYPEPVAADARGDVEVLAEDLDHLRALAEEEAAR